MSSNHFVERDTAALRGLIAQFPLACLVASTPDGLVADHVPLLHEPGSGAYGKLIGHVARNNPLWQYPPEQELLVIFQGASRYISPNWYASKKEGGKVVPTWNYAVVHAHCTLSALHEPEAILPILERLTHQHEAGQAHPWKVSDAPEDYIERMLNSIVAIELSIHRMEGKWKVSQNQPAKNRQSVVEGLLAQGDDESVLMAQLVQKHVTDQSGQT
ncbi:MAG: FMN-binding negative transcriptional regulator [bacterium]|jgi:transcriptional regulator